MPFSALGGYCFFLNLFIYFCSKRHQSSFEWNFANQSIILFSEFSSVKFILCNKCTWSNMKICNTKLSHCRTIPRKNAAINLECHRRHFLFEITRNIGHKYSLAVCLSESFDQNFRRNKKKKFGQLFLPKEVFSS